MMLKRRAVLGAAGALLAAPRVGRAQDARVLKFIPYADAAVLDPVWTTSYATRNHALLVFDTLYGLNDRFEPQPQMVAGHVTEDDGKLWRLTLRPGLAFHDGQPVLARDCVASIRRWARRDAFGQALMAATDELSAPDDRTIRFRLKRSFPLLPAALGKPGSNVPVIMPERLASTDAYTQVKEMVGSGPFRFLAGEHVPGARLSYARFEGYVPREGGEASFTSGPRVAHFERVEWHVVPDPATAAAAVQSGSVDWLDHALIDLVPVLKRDAGLEVRVNDPTGLIGNLRFNHLLPPFDNPAVRRVMLAAVSQADCMSAAAGGDPALSQTGVGFFDPASPMASEVGMEALGSLSDPAKAKKALAEAGYKGERVVILAGTDVPRINAVSEVVAETMRQMGVNLDYVAADWGSVVSRATVRKPIEEGGYNCYCTYWAGIDQWSPAVHNFLRGNGEKAPNGWPTSPELEHLRDAWFTAPDEASQKDLAARMQKQAFLDVPYVPLGKIRQPTAYRKGLVGMLSGPPQFTNIRRA